MRHIHVEAGLRLRFAGRCEAFNEGVEIGVLAANMAAALGEFTMTLAKGSLDQARALAGGLNYRVHVVRETGDFVEAMFLTGRRRPRLQLIHTAAAGCSDTRPGSQDRTSTA